MSTLRKMSKDGDLRAKTLKSQFLHDAICTTFVLHCTHNLQSIPFVKLNPDSKILICFSKFQYWG